jgi:predicted membrane protein
MNNHLLLSPTLAKSLYWVAVCVCGLAHLAILRSIVRSVPRRRTEIAWAIVPALALAAVLVMTWRRLYVSA